MHGNLLFVGAGLGLVTALVIAYAIYRLGAKLNMRRFFRVLGTILMIFAAGLLVDAVENLQQLGWLTFGEHVLWNSAGVVSEASSVGDVLHTLLGYADHPTVLQALVWITYVTVSLVFFMRIGRGGRREDSKTSASRVITSTIIGSTIATKEN